MNQKGSILCAAAFAALALGGTGSAAARNAGPPFAAYSGTWSGGGTIVMTDGSRERIRCRATYAPGNGGTSLQLGVRCASDSYTIDLAGRLAAAVDGSVSGSWQESTRQVSGDVAGRIPGPGQLSLNLAGSPFLVQIAVSTSSSRQTVVMHVPGTSIDSVQIDLRRS